MRRHGVGEGAVHVTVRCAGTINASVGAHARTDAKTNKGSYLSVNQHRGHRRLRDAPDRPLHTIDQPTFFSDTHGWQSALLKMPISPYRPILLFVEMKIFFRVPRCATGFIKEACNELDAHSGIG